MTRPDYGMMEQAADIAFAMEGEGKMNGAMAAAADKRERGGEIGGGEFDAVEAKRARCGD